MHDLNLETDRFRDWAAADAKPQEGQWECDYDAWPAWHRAVLTCIDEHAGKAWSNEDVEQVLYAIARDNDTQYLAREIRIRQPDTLRFLARAALARGEAQARWQLAVELENVPGEESEHLLLALATDEDEYVRRRAIRALTAIGARAAEELAWAAWHRADDQQEWSRMSALECLRQLRSPRLAALLAEALRDARPFLRQLAERMRDEELKLAKA
ncbi:HEAT repeat domain-containing protein [Lysobacter sp. CA199]|uniref:HEAT repeat domain-containing protein n=1 Tax=Lysobacter sp. CA199 TaxID=3455608 RepID=UPI003F8D875F